MSMFCRALNCDRINEDMQLDLCSVHSARESVKRLCGKCGLREADQDETQCTDCYLDSKFKAEEPALKPSPKADHADKLALHFNALRDLVVSKAHGYSKGNGFTTTRLFSSSDTVERILSRLDDKLSRWACEGPTRENIDDMVGYLMLLRVERESEQWKKREASVSCGEKGRVKGGS